MKTKTNTWSKRRRKQTLALKTTIKGLNQQLYDSKQDFQRLLSQHVILSVFPSEGDQPINEMVDKINYQAAYLFGEANRISHGQKEKMGFAICETQPGIPLHPLVWLPNEVVEHLFRILSERKTPHFSLVNKTEDFNKNAFTTSFRGV